MKKIIFVAVGLILIGGGVGASMLEAEDKKPEIRQVKVDKIEPKEVELKEPEKIAEIPVVEPSVEVTIEPVQEVEPEPILSTQQYAEMYLDLSGHNQVCFDEVVKAFPDRFTPEVRENNIKALTVFASVCGTGIMESLQPSRTGSGMPGRGAIHLYGTNGEFFDSDIAKAAH